MAVRPPRMNFLERAAASLSPTWGMRRVREKMAYGTLVDGYGVSGYTVPGMTVRPSMRGWGATPNTVDKDIIPALGGSRAGARDLYMNTPVAAGLLRRIQTNVVGSGLRMKPTPNRDILGLTEEEARAWERKTEFEFGLWADTQECDSGRRLNFADMQSLVLISILMSGDCFVLLPYIQREGVLYDLRVQILESDYVSNPYNQMETSTFAGGVETDEWNAPIAYHIRTIPENFPIMAQATGFSNWIGKWERISAYGELSNRRNVLHLMNVERPGQRRGITFLAPVIEKLKQMSRLSESELTAAVITSFFTVFVKNTLPGTNGLGVPYDAAQRVTNPAVNKGDRNLIEFGPGAVNYLENGEDIVAPNSSRPNALFQPFFQAMCQEVGSAIEVPAEVVMLQFSHSYSASRAALNEAWRFYQTWRHRLVRKFNKPVYEEWLVEAVTKGRIVAPGFFQKPEIRAAWSGSRWTGPGQGQINPEVETKAARERIEGGLSSRADEAEAMHGGDWEDTMRRRAREDEFLKELGIPDVLLAGEVETPPGGAPTDPATPKAPPKKKNELSESSKAMLLKEA